MKTARRPRSPRPAPLRVRGRPALRRGKSRSGVANAGELAKLRARLAEAEATLRAIRNGEVDAVVVAGKAGPRVFTLQGAERAYRVLIESMNEGALTLSADAVILYANQRFAQMVKRPLKQVMGSSFHAFLSATDQAALRPLLRRTAKAGGRLNCTLYASDGSQLPAHISICGLAKDSSMTEAVGLVVADMTETRHNEALQRDLTRQLMQAQEAERGRVANELRVNITQLLYIILGRCEALAEKFPAGEGSAGGDTTQIQEMLRKTAEEVERIWRSLWSHELEKLGLAAALEKTNAEFMERTGVNIEMDCPPLAERLPADTELALYRILQKALSNVERHAHARNVTVGLTQPNGFVQLTIQDDGIGFKARKKNGQRSFGLLRMRERAAHVGGTLSVQSSARTGTQIEVRIPLPPKASP